MELLLRCSKQATALFGDADGYLVLSYTALTGHPLLALERRQHDTKGLRTYKDQTCEFGLQEGALLTEVLKDVEPERRKPKRFEVGGAFPLYGTRGQRQ